MIRNSKSPAKTPSKTPKKKTNKSSNYTNNKNYSPQSTATSIIPDNPCYLCHYRNAMYMGGIKSFQRHGRGILLHDNGASILSEFYNDLKHGHNIVMYENCILSMMYTKNKYTQAVVRIPNFLLYLRYNTDQILDGKAVMLEYSARNIYYLTYRKGLLIDKKLEQQYSIINRVFDLENIQFLIGTQHTQALRLQFQKDEHINSHHSGTKCNFGFYRKGLITGLGVTVSVKDPNLSKAYNPDTHRINDQFYLRIIQRGYFLNSQLSGMGQKWFKNGNMYVGNFKSDIFEGQGILKNTLKQNWVYGYFQNGNMCQLLDYSHEGQIKKCWHLIHSMHQRKNSWINNEIQVPQPHTFTKQIENILKNNPKSKIKTLEQKKQEVLKKIQQNFMCEDQNSSPLASSRHIQSYNNIGHDDNIQQPKSSDFRGFSEKFLEEKEQNSYKQQMNENQYDEAYNSPSESLPLNYQTSSSRYRHSKIFEKSPDIRSKPSKSRSLIKLHEVPTTKQSSQRYRHNERYGNTSDVRNSVSPMRILQESRNGGRNKVYNTYDANEEYDNKLNVNEKQRKNKYQQNSYRNSGIRDQAPTFNLDSKRIISRSRLFKYLNHQQDQQEPPKFTYKYAKNI